MKVSENAPIRPRTTGCQPSKRASTSATLPLSVHDSRGPVAALDDAHDVQEPPRRHPVVHAMAARAHPEVRGHLDVEVRDALGRHQPAPRRAPGEARRVGAESQLAHAAVYAVGADQHVGLGRSAVLEARDRAPVLLLDRRPVDGRHARAPRAARRPAAPRDRRDGNDSTARRTPLRPPRPSGARCRVRPSSHRR